MTSINLSQGLICLKEQKYVSGIKEFEAVIARESDNAQEHHGRGQWLYEKGEIEKVIESYYDALNINRDYANALNSKEKALGKLNKKKLLSPPKVIYEDFLEALKRNKDTVNQKYLEQQEKFTRDSGQEG